MEPYEEKEHRGYTCKVYYDSNPESPAEWDTLGTIYTNTRRYNPQNHTIEEIMVEGKDGQKFISADYIYVRIYAYEHGGITLSSSRTVQQCGWDDYLFGVMAVHRDDAIKEFGRLTIAENYESVLKCLEAEVKEWDQYFRGEVFGYEVTKDGEFIDSCWGFYGDAEMVMQEGIDIINYYADNAERREKIVEPFWID